MIDRVVIGASVSMTPPGVDKLCGNGGIRLVTCVDGRVVGGFGSVGFLEHAGTTDLAAFMAEIAAQRAKLAEIAAGPQPDNPRANLYTFTRI